MRHRNNITTDITDATAALIATEPYKFEGPYHELDDVLRVLRMPHDLGDAVLVKNVFKREENVFLLIITALLKRATCPLHDHLVHWAGYYLLHGVDKMRRDLPTGRWEHATELTAMAELAFGTSHMSHQLGRFVMRRSPTNPTRLTPNEALLHTAVYQSPHNFTMGQCGAICLMSVFDTEAEASTYMTSEMTLLTSHEP